MSDEIVHATGDLFPTVAGLETSTGVAMNPPPQAILGQVSRMVIDAAKTIPEGSRGALVGIATADPDGKVNVNLAVAVKAGDHVRIISWLGKSWQKPVEGGAAVQVVF